VLKGTGEIRDAYRDEGVARRYVDARFKEPFGALLHSRQAAALRRLVRRHRPARALEIAPGPARLTVALAELLEDRLMVVDTSAEMLAEARRRLGPGAERFGFVQGDAVQLPFRAVFDLVYVFRLIRHFEASDRARLYAQVAHVLKPGGVFAFDAVNAVVSTPLRARAPLDYPIYDALLRPEEIRAELWAAGFEVVALEGVQRRAGLLGRLQVLAAPRSRRLARIAMELVDRLGGGEPLEWIVTCRRA